MKRGWEPSYDWSDGSARSCHCPACWAGTVISQTGGVRGGNHERGDLAYGTGVGGGGDCATLRTGPFTCDKAEATQEKTKRNWPGPKHTLRGKLQGVEAVGQSAKG